MKEQCDGYSDRIRLLLPASGDFEWSADEEVILLHHFIRLFCIKRSSLHHEKFTNGYLGGEVVDVLFRLHGNRPLKGMSSNENSHVV